MANLNLPENLLHLSCVDEISQTVISGTTKRFRIRAYSDVPELTSILTTLWPFCEVITKEGHTVVDFMVNPDELVSFSARLTKMSPVVEKHKAKILIPLDGTVDDGLKKKVKSCLRSGDKVVWGSNYLAVVTDSNQAAVRSVRRRVEKQLKVAPGNSITQKNRLYDGDTKV